MTAIGASTLRFVLAREMSNRLYDSTLEVVALTISRDAILSDGDILAESLLDRLVEALGDPIYYRIIGPGGRFITGYSDAPAGSPAQHEGLPTGETVFYDGTYQRPRDKNEAGQNHRPQKPPVERRGKGR